MADQKALGKMGMLGRMAKSRPEVVFGFLGCMAQARGDALLNEMPHLDLVVGTQKFHRVADYVDELVARKRARSRSAQPESNGRSAFFDCRCRKKKPVRRKPFAISSSRRNRRRRSFRSCRDATCIALFASCRRRAAPSAAAPLTKSCREVRALVADGVKEVTLLGQIVNLYGRHEFPAVAAVAAAAQESPFVQLLEAVQCSRWS